MIRALLFDFDGLILETESPVFQSYLELYQEFHQDLPLDKWSTGIGTFEQIDYIVELEKQVGHSLEKDVLARRRLQRELELIDRLNIQPGVMDYLQTARSLKLRTAVASSASCKWVTGHLERLDVQDYFDYIFAGDDVSRVKPDPELYLHALSSLDIKPNDAIAFEDSPNGISAAKKAGLFCVVVPNAMTKRLAVDHADLRLNSLVDMPLPTLIRLVENNHRG
jgi:HAD superfamily hydrolase (TIGR01509 family)